MSVAKNLLELAQSEQLTTFMELVKIGGVEEAFSKFGEYTLFIPSEAAFHCKYSTKNTRNTISIFQRILKLL